MKRTNLAAVVPVVLLLLSQAFPAFTVHISHPWSVEPARSALPVHIISPQGGPAFPGAAMQAESRAPWYKYTWPDTVILPNRQFYFVSYIPTQFNATASPTYYYGGPKAFDMSLFPVEANEIWIVPNSLNTYTVHTEPPWFEGSKVAFLFNPWPGHAPMAKVNSDAVYSYLPQSTDPRLCGWYRVNFPDSLRTVLFKSTHGTESYGQGGLGSGQAVDLTADFSAADTLFILPGPLPGGPPKVSALKPAVTGICKSSLSIAVRDFSINHPDFEPGAQAAGDIARLGMVANTLGPDRKPIKGPSPAPYQTVFVSWFNTDSANADTTLRNYETCRELPLSIRKDGNWEYDSYREASHSYFPIDDFNRFGEKSQSMYVDRSTGSFRTDSAGAVHNFSFCMELHAEFIHEAGHFLEVEGDDDIWVFINNKLALDLGGIHEPVSGAVHLNTLGLVPGQRYPFDLFYCERQSQGSSLHIKTSLSLTQPSEYFSKGQVVANGPVTFSFFEVNSDGRRCAPSGSGDTLPAPSRFWLQGPGFNSAVELAVGTSYGGIVIHTSKTELSLDTSKIAGLAPGSYSITHTSERSGKSGQVRFTLPHSVKTGGSAPVGEKLLKAHVMGDLVRVRFNPGAEGAGMLSGDSPVLSIFSLEGAVIYSKRLIGTGGFSETLKAADLGRGLRLVSIEAGNRRWVLPLAIP